MCVYEVPGSSVSCERKTRGNSASQVATSSPHVFPCTSTRLSSNRARDPLSLKLANARELAGCGGVRGMGGTRRVGMDFEIPPPLFLHTVLEFRACPLSNAARCSCDAACCAVRHAPLRFGGACTPSRICSIHDSLPRRARRAPETPARQLPVPGLRPVHTRPNNDSYNADTAVLRAIHSTSGTTW